MNIYLDDLQLSKTVQVILAKFCPNKLSSFDLAIFMGLTVLKYRIFCPFSDRMQAEVVNFFVPGPAMMRYFLLSSPFSRL